MKKLISTILISTYFATPSFASPDIPYATHCNKFETRNCINDLEQFIKRHDLNNSNTVTFGEFMLSANEAFADIYQRSQISTLSQKDAATLNRLKRYYQNWDINKDRVIGLSDDVFKDNKITLDDYDKQNKGKHIKDFCEPAPNTRCA